MQWHRLRFTFAIKKGQPKGCPEKLRTGGKLSFEEFQALMEDSTSEEDDD
jgi:hypothetical protein